MKRIELSQFSYNINETPDGILKISLIGAIDEESKFPADLGFSNYNLIHIDFAKVDFINSGGVKRWLRFCDVICKNENIKIIFQNCTSMVVNQINLTEGFLPKNAEVDSVFVPIFCSRCDQCFNAPLLMSLLNQDFDTLLDRVRPKDCKTFPECKKVMEVDAVKEIYFRFTNR